MFDCLLFHIYARWISRIHFDKDYQNHIYYICSLISAYEIGRRCSTTVWLFLRYVSDCLLFLSSASTVIQEAHTQEVYFRQVIVLYYTQHTGVSFIDQHIKISLEFGDWYSSHRKIFCDILYFLAANTLVSKILLFVCFKHHV